MKLGAGLEHVYQGPKFFSLHELSSLIFAYTVHRSDGYRICQIMIWKIQTPTKM